MRRSCSSLILLICLLAAWLPQIAPAAAAGPRPQVAATPAPVAAPMTAKDGQKILSHLSVAEKVGQLFVVTFEGNDVAASSDIATLVRDYHIGGVVLLPVNGNFQNVPAEIAVADEAGGEAQKLTLSTPQQIARLTDQLQGLRIGSTQPVSTSVDSSATSALPSLPQRAPEAAVEPAVGRKPAAGTPSRPSSTQTPDVARFDSGNIPLLIGLEWSGDDSSIFAGTGGFTPLPSAMAIGATWTPALAENAGQVVGQELQAVGVNLLLGPPLDVLDAPRPAGKGDLGTRSFGGDPFWAGQLGRGFIRGVAGGSEGAVVTAATHFPGQGASDRRPEDEVATVQKSVQQLRQIELAPFAAVTAGSDLTVPGTTAMLMTSHIRYRGFQGNIRQLTPPISLAPQLQDLMALREFSDWRSGGGVLMSDALGVPAIRRYYDPQLGKFPHRQVAQDAFLAGNDLLFLSRFALTDNWPDQFAAIKETILFFQSKYEDDSEFRARVDASVERIIRLKQHIYPGGWTASSAPHETASIEAQVGHGTAVTYSVARAGITLIYPGRDELADRLPSAPLGDENILIFTDARQVRDCASCEPRAPIASTALQDIMLRLYGPNATGQVAPNRIRSLTFADLDRFLTATGQDAADVDDAISAAKWIIFAELDDNPDEPASEGLQAFLAKRSDSLRDKRLVVMAFDAPYYLDTTEVSKLTAYFGVYAKTGPFLETAVRALFREFSPVGAPPVTIMGINYVLLNQLESASGQIISLSPVGVAEGMHEKVAAIQVGSAITLETGVIVDHNGHPVPDGTPVEFHLRYPTEALQLAPVLETTISGQASTEVRLDRAGELWITATSGEAKDSTRIVLKVGGDAPGSIATVMPTPTALSSATPTPLPSVTPTPIPSRTPAAQRVPAPPSETSQPRVAFPAFLYGLVGVFLASGTAFTVRKREPHPDSQRQLEEALTAALWAVAVAWTAYLLYSLGWLPGATQLQARGSTWAAGVVTLSGGTLSLLWSGRKSGGSG